MTDLPQPSVECYNVSFNDQGRSLVALALRREGEEQGQSTLFFLEPVDGMTLQDTASIADFLNKYIVRFGVMTKGTNAEAP